MKNQNFIILKVIPLLMLILALILTLKVNNKNTKKRCEICSKLTIKTPERHQ